MDDVDPNGGIFFSFTPLLILWVKGVLAAAMLGLEPEAAALAREEDVAPPPPPPGPNRCLLRVRLEVVAERVS